jgi:uncharacterized protein YegP (UPF0339 family)
MGWFELKKASDGQFLFNLHASNAQVILTSELYKAKSGAQNGIESVQKNSPNDSQYERKTSTDGKHYFVLKAKNHEVIGTSQRYSSASAMEDGIASVKSNGSTTDVRDNT